MEKNIEKIPTYALPYLVNGDASNLTEDEIKQIDEICREQGIELVVENSLTIAPLRSL